MSEPLIWLPPPSNLELEREEVHLWKASLDLAPEEFAQLFDVLSEEERIRAKGFVFEKARNRFTAARGHLRKLVANYLETTPDKIKFKFGPMGKPALEGNTQLRFNLAHTGDLAIYAFALASELGVDVEHTREGFGNPEIVGNYFSPKEQAEYGALAPDLQEEAFYLGWTRKEAYVKAQGKGLQLPLDSFSVSLSPGQPATLASPDAARWELHSFCPQAGFFAALVVEGRKRSLRYLIWR